MVYFVFYRSDYLAHGNFWESKMQRGKGPLYRGSRCFVVTTLAFARHSKPSIRG